MWLQRGFCSSKFTLRLWPLWLQPPEGKGSLIQGLGGGGGGWLLHRLQAVHLPLIRGWEPSRDGVESS